MLAVIVTVLLFPLLRVSVNVDVLFDDPFAMDTGEPVTDPLPVVANTMLTAVPVFVTALP